MRSETTHQTITHTRYHCEEEGCDFSCSSEEAAERHMWTKHRKFQIQHFDIGPSYGDDPPLNVDAVYLPSKEHFEGYCRKQQVFSVRNKEDAWEGPGWYYTQIKNERLGGCGCCYEDFAYLYPIQNLIEEWGALRDRIDSRLKEMRELADVQDSE